MKIENSGKIYAYDFDSLTVQQVELALTVGEYRLHQKEAEQPETIDRLLRSRAGEYLSLIGSFLFVPVKDDELQPFRRKESLKTEAFIKSLPASQMNVILEAVENFFLKCERKILVSTIKYGESESSKMRALLPLLSAMKNTGKT